MKIKDITGQHFGKLIAMTRLLARDKHKHSLWTCQCDCGNVSVIALSELTTGNTKSCGCPTSTKKSKEYD